MNKLIKVSANWCGPCKMLEAKLDTIDSEFVRSLKTYDIDTDEGKKFAADRKIKSIPVLIVEDSFGNEIDRIPPSSQPLTLTALRNFVYKHETVVSE